ncbi:MAG: RNase adapter RapZ, partial [Eubacteriales bacterium]|nr:RNase adapter RapZ [Eubacteriales bacterium]
IRFLPNPHYQEALRDLTGLEPAVKDYVMGWTLTHQFLKKVKDLLAFLVPCYIAEGKTQLIIAVGCTGGKHRSVTIANILATFFTDLGQNVSTMHRDIDKA